jgi:hypothetical protein
VQAWVPKTRKCFRSQTLVDEVPLGYKEIMTEHGDYLKHVLELCGSLHNSVLNVGRQLTHVKQHDVR